MCIRDRERFKQNRNFQFPLIVGVPINTTEFVMFADPANQIAVDFVTKSDCLPGTRKLKPNLRLKSKALEDLGWKHVFCHEEQLRDLNTFAKLEQILVLFNQFAEEQKEVIERQQWKRSE